MPQCRWIEAARIDRPSRPFTRVRHPPESTRRQCFGGTIGDARRV
jgi:hypothetical protein